MNNLKPFEKEINNRVEPFESNPKNAPKIESIRVSKKGTILMIRMNNEIYGYFVTE